MDYETLYFELLEDVQNFEKSVQKQMEELISLNLYRRARMAMQEMVILNRKTTLNRSCWNGCIENRIGEM